MVARMIGLVLACLLVGTTGCTKPGPVVTPKSPAGSAAPHTPDACAPSLWKVDISFEATAKGQTDNCGVFDTPAELAPLYLRVRSDAGKSAVDVGMTLDETGEIHEPAKLDVMFGAPCTFQLKGSLPGKMTIDKDWISESDLDATLTLAADGNLTGALTRLDYVLVEDGAGEGETEHCVARNATITGARIK
jgi:hypothetical protein